MKYTLLLIFTILQYSSYAQNWLNKDRPSSGQTVSIQIPINSTKINDVENVYAYLYIIKEDVKKDEVLDLPLVIKNGVYSGKFKIPEDAIAIYAALTSEETNDHNYGNGWTTLIYKKGKVIPNAELYLTNAIMQNSYAWNENGFNDHIFKMLNTTYQKNNIYYSIKDLKIYYDIYNRIKPTTDTSFEISILNKIYHDKNLDIDQLPTLQNYFEELGDQSTAKEIEERIKKEKPMSILQQEIMNPFYELTTTKEKLLFFQKVVDSLNGNTDKWKYRLQDMAFFTAVDLVDENKFIEALALRKYFIELAYFNQLYANITNKITADDFNLNVNDEFYNNLIKTITEMNKDSLLYERDLLSTFFEEKKSKAYSSESRKRNLAKIHAKDNKLESAIEILREIDDRKLFRYSYYGGNYFQLLIKNKQYQEAISLWERMKSNGYSDTKIDFSILSLIEKGLLTNEQYTIINDRIQTASNERYKKKLTQNFSNIPSPFFQLKDLDNNDYSLNNFKGKKLLVDFWSTWCGPCISSFEEMYQIQEHFKQTDSTIQFIFILTLENGSKESVVKKAKEIMQSKNVKFLVLYDYNSNFSKQYQITALPSKIFIDKNGNFRYKTIGYSKDYIGNLNKIQNIFSLMN